jgi:hypothetical protein
MHLLRVLLQVLGRLQEHINNKQIFDLNYRFMKHYILSVFAALTLFISCSKSNNDNGGGDSNLSSKPEAKAAYDNSNFGVYKGVFVGSTGYLVIRINNGDNKISALLVIDGRSYTFTPEEPTLVQNQNTTITFKNGSDYFNFNVAANGSDPKVTTVVISGHDGAQLTLLKETSTSLVKCLEGSYDGADWGTWNAIVRGDVFIGLVRSKKSGKFNTATGTVDGSNNVTGRTNYGTNFSGSLSEVNGGGTWQSPDPANGKWTLKRTY